VTSAPRSTLPLVVSQGPYGPGGGASHRRKLPDCFPAVVSRCSVSGWRSMGYLEPASPRWRSHARVGVPERLFI
jgi:hypothetical protein